MYRYPYKIMINRIAEIKQRQFQISNYLDSNKEVMTEFQRENINSLMITLKGEKEELETILSRII